LLVVAASLRRGDERGDRAPRLQSSRARCRPLATECGIGRWPMI